MDRSFMLEMGLMLNGIGTMLDDESLERAKPFMDKLESMLIQFVDSVSWIPVTYRQATDDEEEYYGAEYVLNCKMPEDGQEIIVCTKDGSVSAATCSYDDGYETEEGYEWVDEIIAWMPLPQPYERG